MGEDYEVVLGQGLATLLTHTCACACYHVHMPSLTRRTQLLLDDDLHRRLRETAAERGISIGALIREAIGEKLSSAQDARAKAIDKLLAAEPMPVEDWPAIKRQMLEDRYAGVMKSYDESHDEA